MTKSNIDEPEHGVASNEEGRQTARREAPGHDDAQTASEIPPPPRKRVFVIPFLIVAGLLGYGAFKHWETDQRAAETQQDAIDFTPEVTTFTAQADSTPIKLTLPGQTEPFNTTTIYPRATGYIAERRVDIGSRVKKGDLLVRIAAPDVDAQLAQAKSQFEQTKAAQAQAQASLDQAKANLELAKVTYGRTNAMTQKGYETVQNNDNQRTQVQARQAGVETAEAGIKVAAANTMAQQATVDRLATMVAFEQVIAPFDGIVTTRGVEKGDLVNADSKTGTPLFTVAAEKTLRVTVHVPQADAFAIHEGLVGTAYLPQKPEKTFSGHVARNSVALLNSARTLATEVDIESPDGALKPGAFVNVTFEIPRDRPNVVIPAEALIFNQHGLQVAVVQDDQVRLQTITVYRDFGRTLELRDGVNGGDQLVFNPPPDLTDGMKVKVKAKPPQEQAKE